MNTRPKKIANIDNPVDQSSIFISNHFVWDGSFKWEKVVWIHKAADNKKIIWVIKKNLPSRSP